MIRCCSMPNSGFLIKNILYANVSPDSWYDWIDKTFGQLKTHLSNTISKKSGNKDIENLFLEIVEMRNRIIHGFRITSKEGEQILATKERKENGHLQFEITPKYLMDFIEKNDKLSDLLHEYRGY